MKRLLIATAIMTTLTACSGLKDVDHKWCPPEPDQVSVESIQLKADALFKFDKYTQSDMLPQGVKELDELANHLGDAYTTVKNIQLEGHTDYLGSEEYNQVLSERRAKTVADYLRNKGIDTEYTIVGFGETKPIHQCDNSLKGQALRDCLQPNRRVELKITGVRKIIEKK